MVDRRPPPPGIETIAVGTMGRLVLDQADELARGGMGRVFRVHDPGLDRWIAVKRVDPAQVRGTPELAEFLLTEAQTTGRLEHPNIVPIYDLGLDPDGQPMFAMRLIAGRTLTELIVEGAAARSSPRLAAILEIFLKVCDAVEFAHSRGVLHRDLKPDNVMVGGYGEVYVVDWGCALIHGSSPGLPPMPRLDPAPRGSGVTGIAAASDEAFDTARTGLSLGPGRTASQAVVGTIGYMAPEQAMGRISDLDPRADVYSLGAVLYEVLAGHPPRLGDRTPTSTPGAPVPHDAPLAPLPTDVPAELARIAMTALAADRAQRPASVRALSTLVREFLASGS